MTGDNTASWVRGGGEQMEEKKRPLHGGRESDAGRLETVQTGGHSGILGLLKTEVSNIKF